MSKLICPVCQGKDFKEYESNGAVVAICSTCGSCYSYQTRGWFHYGEVKGGE